MISAVWISGVQYVAPGSGAPLGGAGDRSGAAERGQEGRPQAGVPRECLGFGIHNELCLMITNCV